MSYTTINVIADDDYFNDKDIKKAKEKLKRIGMKTIYYYETEMNEQSVFPLDKQLFQKDPLKQ